MKDYTQEVQGIKDFFSDRWHEVMRGELSAIQYQAILKEVADKIKDEMKANASDLQGELIAQPKTFSQYGYSFEQKSGGAMWDFKKVPEWITTKQRLTEIETKCKNAFLNKEKGIEPIDTETGEMITLPGRTFKKDSLISKKS